MAESGGLSDEKKEKAEQLKNAANEEFKAEHYDQAIDLYTQVFFKLNIKATITPRASFLR